MSQRPRTKGLDASRWQAGIDFSACRAAGFEFVALRATMGARGEDPLYSRFRRECEEAGIFVISYHLEYPDVDAVAQVDNLVRVAGEGPFALDVEPPDDYPPATYRQWRETTQAACYEASARFGWPPLVYGSHDFLDALELPDDLRDCPLWATGWGTRGVRVPRPWRRATLVQTGKERSPNARGPHAGPITDVNEYEGTLEQLRAEVTFNG